MKRILSQTVCAVLALLSLFSFAACGSKSSSEESSQSSDASATQAVEITVAATEAASSAPAELKKEIDLTKLHTPNMKGDQFAGYWIVEKKTDNQNNLIVYEFDGEGHSYILIGTTGMFGTYEIKRDNNKDMFYCPSVFGDENYTYEFSKDRNSVTLKGVTDGSSFTMKKTDSKSSVPEPPEEPVIDDLLLGAWKDDTGAYLYFDKNGIMYTNQLGVNFFFYTYSAENGVITQTYTMKDESTETAKYKIENDVLTCRDFEYKRCSADELS